MRSRNSLTVSQSLKAPEAAGGLVRKGLNVLVCLGAMMLVHSALGDTYCVTDAAELAAALRDVRHNSKPDEIQLVEGVYHGKFRFNSRQKDDGLAIKGGYVLAKGGASLAPTDNGRCIERASSATVDPGRTVLDGGNKGSVLRLRNSYRPGADEELLEDHKLVLDGLTIQHGKGRWSERDGGGLYVSTSGNVEVRNSTITSNQATEDGGGLYVDTADSVAVENTTIGENKAKYGGGISVKHVGSLSFTKSVIRGNEAQSGGGIDVRGSAKVVLDENQIVYNTARGFSSYHGGGLYVEDCDEVEIRNNVVNENVADHKDARGGGVYLRYSAGQCRVTKPSPMESVGCRVLFTENTIAGNAADEGGGVFVTGLTSPSCRKEPEAADVPWFERKECDGFSAATGDYGVSFTGNVLHGNLARSSGGAIYMDDSDHTSLTENEISENTANGTGAFDGGGGVHIRNVKGLGAFGALEIRENDIFRNTSQRNGGGILSFWVGKVQIVRNVITGNTTVGTDDARDHRGGGLYLQDYVVGAVHENVIDGNVAAEGGALYAFINEKLRHDEPNLPEQAFDELDQMSVVNNMIRNNRAENAGEGKGGGLFFYAPYRVTLRGNEIRGNRTDNEGAGIYVHNAGAYRVWRVGPGAVVSPVAGTVHAIHVESGQEVEEGGLVATIQAEGTETLTPVLADRSGKVSTGGYPQEGYKVDAGETLLAIGGQANTRAVVKCMGGAVIGGAETEQRNVIAENAITGVGAGARDACTHGGSLTFEEKAKDRLSGAGVKVYLSYSTTVMNNHIVANVGAEKGGGVAIERPFCEVTVDGNVVSGNTSEKGGGVYVFQYGGQPSEIWGDLNTAQSAKVDNPLIIVNNLVHGNHAEQEGGGVYLCTTLTSPYRYSADDGWAVVTENGRATAIVTNNTISDNDASAGGGIWLMHLRSSTTASFFNNVIWENRADTAADVRVDALHAIWRSNNVGRLSLVEPTNIADMDSSNVSEDPVFLPGLEEYRCTAEYVCVDRGNNHAPAMRPTDIVGNVRILDGDGDGVPVVDMGSFEREEL